MTFISSNRKTAISVASAFLFAVALAGCSTAPAPTSQTPVADEKPAGGVDLKKSVSTPTDNNLKSITWLTSYDSALSTAKKDNKPVMIDFYADWCTACKYLDKNIYTAPDVIKKSKNFVNVKINTDKDTNTAERYKITGLPTLIFLDGNGKVLWRLEGAPTDTSFFIDTMQKAQNKFISGA